MLLGLLLLELELCHTQLVVDLRSGRGQVEEGKWIYARGEGRGRGGWGPETRGGAERGVGVRGVGGGAERG